MKIPLVLISGLLSNEFLWKHQAKHLSEIAEIHIFSPTENSSEKMIEHILKTAPPKFALAGHSMRGWLCFEVLRAAPSRVSKVCLINTSARDDSMAKRENRQKMIKRSREGQFQEITKEISDFFIQNPLLKQQVEKMFIDVGCHSFINQEEAMINRNPSEPILPTIRCPALVIHAAQDQNFTLEEHIEMVEKIPNAKLAIIEDSGHMSPLEMPQAVTTLLRFWLSYF
ncbi:MAG: alpha/beta hydrolase [Chlamydiota bacterium]|nr:alpha/beta hydrolase [Chlamydiota bacterium]